MGIISTPNSNCDRMPLDRKTMIPGTESISPIQNSSLKWFDKKCDEPLIACTTEHVHIVDCSKMRSLARDCQPTHTHTYKRTCYVKCKMCGPIMGTNCVRQNCRSACWLNRLRCGCDRVAHINLYNRARSSPPPPSPHDQVHGWQRRTPESWSERERDRVRTARTKRNTHSHTSVTRESHERTHARSISMICLCGCCWISSLVGSPKMRSLLLCVYFWHVFWIWNSP